MTEETITYSLDPLLNTATHAVETDNLLIAQREQPPKKLLFEALKVIPGLLRADKIAPNQQLAYIAWRDTVQVETMEGVMAKQGSGSNDRLGVLFASYKRDDLNSCFKEFSSPSGMSSGSNGWDSWLTKAMYASPFDLIDPTKMIIGVADSNRFFTRVYMDEKNSKRAEAGYFVFTYDKPEQANVAREFIDTSGRPGLLSMLGIVFSTSVVPKFIHRPYQDPAYFDMNSIDGRTLIEINQNIQTVINMSK